MTPSIVTLADGRRVDVLRIGTAPGAQLDVLTLGAAVHRLVVPCGDGERRNVTLAHADLDSRLTSTDYLGATVGRYANRIADGRFVLDGREFRLDVNDRGNTLHGGADGFDRRLWEVVGHAQDEVTLRLESPDGDMGFPGTLDARVTYRVEGSTVQVHHEATTDAPTVVSLTSHAYVNLDGEGAGSIAEHRLRVEADTYLPIDATGIPSGELAGVAGTPFDLTTSRALGTVLATDHAQLTSAGGIDHCYVVRGAGLRTAAVLESSRSRTRLELRTDQPGLQVYTGNFLDGSVRSTAGGHHSRGSGVALEPQALPDSPHHLEWPQAVLRPGSTYRATSEWAFGTC